MRQVVILLGEDGFWVAEVPSLPGCVSQGRTKEEAIANVKDAIEQWIEAARALGRNVPTDRMEAQVCVV